MFEVGKHYDVTTGTPDDFSDYTVKVIAWEHPLLKYDTQFGESGIINTTSPFFFKAQAAPSIDEARQAERSFWEDKP